MGTPYIHGWEQRPYSGGWSSARAVARGHENGPMTEDPPYPAALRLAGRRVVVVGGGHVAQRRVPALIAAGAEVVVVSPQVTPSIEGLVSGGEVTWHQRGF